MHDIISTANTKAPKTSRVSKVLFDIILRKVTVTDTNHGHEKSVSKHGWRRCFHGIDAMQRLIYATTDMRND